MAKNNELKAYMVVTNTDFSAVTLAKNKEEAWGKAIDLDYLRRHNPKEYPKWGNLKLLDVNMEAYGDRKLYVDETTGIFYKEYESIGD